MKILDRLPIYQEDSIITVQGEALQVWKNQIIVWLSIRDTSRPFPAILDTGPSHNLSIARRHLERWTGAELRQIGTSKIGRTTVPHFAADVLIHRNVPRRFELRGTFPLTMDQGIAVVPDDSPAATRLPILGLKAIVHNELRLVIDGRRREVSVNKLGWEVKFVSI
jgi:hypothetical protein